ncbi:hypothetical protein EVAR_30885_1 [Eumeta japonica]|uniref:Uncharacterized protein n=1 Tax=Eumeta variegata TaxID=151549 RepID=A0A4C1V4U4_EUMVA|nr:hypothetical protein EVAR_30885_1 [Eumeta japonica]
MPELDFPFCGLSANVFVCPRSLIPRSFVGGLRFERGTRAVRRSVRFVRRIVVRARRLIVACDVTRVTCSRDALLCCRRSSMSRLSLHSTAVLLHSSLTWEDALSVPNNLGEYYRGDSPRDGWWECEVGTTPEGGCVTGAYYRWENRQRCVPTVRPRTCTHLTDVVELICPGKDYGRLLVSLHCRR